jgi:hypothetical protein
LYRSFQGLQVAGKYLLYEGVVDIFFAFEVLVDGSYGKLGPLGYVLNGGAAETFFGEDLAGRVEDLSAMA